MHWGRTKIKPQFDTLVYIYIYMYTFTRRLSTASENKPNQIILQCVVIYIHIQWPQESATAVTATATAGGTEMLFDNKLEMAVRTAGVGVMRGSNEVVESVVSGLHDDGKIAHIAWWRGEKANILLISTHDIYSGDCVNFLRRLFLTRTVKLWCFFGVTMTATTAATVDLTCMGCGS